MRRTVYLSGQMSGLVFGEANDWREHATRTLDALGIATLSPMRRKTFLDNGQPIDPNGMTHKVYSTDAAITTRDHNDVRRCDAVFMCLVGSTRVSIGTMIEAGWAFAYRKPTVLVMEDEGNLHEHPILRACVGYRFADIDDGIDAINYLIGDAR